MADNQVIIGDADVSRATFVRRKITNLVKAANAQTFDLAELFFESKKQQYFAQWGFESFSSYGKQIAKDYNFKWTKIYYLTRIMENMDAAKLERSQYEQVGMLKLRAISRLKPDARFNGVPVSILIRELTLKAGQMSVEGVQFEVDKIMGLTEDESMSWLNIKVKKMAKDNTIMPALALAKKHVGSVGQDEEGHAIDASGGRCLELICSDFLADPNWNVETLNESTKTGGEDNPGTDTDVPPAE
jgi:hypothetical protein